MIKQLVKKISKAVFTRLVKRKVGSFEEPLRVNGYSVVNKNTKFGKNVNLNGLKVLGVGEVYIGNNFHSGIGIRLYTSIHNYDDGASIPYDNTVKLKTIHIGDNVWFGDSVSVIGNVKIGEGAIIQTGSVVVGDIPAFAIAGGHPARVFASRNIEHYERLKDLGKFF